MGERDLLPDWRLTCIIYHTRNHLGSTGTMLTRKERRERQPPVRLEFEFGVLRGGASTSTLN